MNKQALINRYIIFMIGLFINSFGVSFITKASLGTSPISSVPYTLSLGFEPTLGTFTLYMNILLIIVQWTILKKNFPKYYFLQIPVAIIFSWFIDITMNLMSFMVLDNYIIKLICLITGCVILGLGVYLEIIADVIMLPGELFVKSIAVTFDKDFGKIKIVFDVSLTILAGAIGFVLFHKFAGVREGTVIAALLVGFIARFLKQKLVFFEKLLLRDTI